MAKNLRANLTQAPSEGPTACGLGGIDPSNPQPFFLTSRLLKGQFNQQQLAVCGSSNEPTSSPVSDISHSVTISEGSK
jgi:hypothetical protein